MSFPSCEADTKLLHTHTHTHTHGAANQVLTHSSVVCSVVQKVTCELKIGQYIRSERDMKFDTLYWLLTDVHSCSSLPWNHLSEDRSEWVAVVNVENTSTVIVFSCALCVILYCPSHTRARTCVCVCVFSTKLRDWLGRTCPKCRVGRKTLTQSIACLRLCLYVWTITSVHNQDN